MQAELVRSELKRLLRQVPFQRFILTLKGGEQAVIEHPENIAFDPRPGVSTEFYAITGSIRLFSTFESVSSAMLLADVRGPQEEVHV